MSEQLKKPQALVEKLGFGTILVFAFIAPLLFSPITAANVFDFPKWLFTIFSAVLLLVLYGIYTLVNRQLIVPSKWFLIGFVAFLAALLLSMFFTPGNWIVPFLGKGGLLLAFWVIAFTGSVLVRHHAKWVLYALVAAGFLLSWLELISYFGLLGRISSEPIFSGKTFTPLGSQLALASFLVVTLPVSAILAFKQKETLTRVLLYIVLALQGIALVLSISLLLPGQPSSPRFLPFSSGWSIAIDQLKNTKTALIGVGPDNFGSAFTRFRPANLNQTDNWFIRYVTSSNELLTLFTTLGVIGLVSFGLLVGTFAKTTWENKEESEVGMALFVGLLMVLIQIALIPANFSVIFLLFTLGLLSLQLVSDGVQKIPHTQGAIVVGFLTSIAPLVLLFFIYRALMAEVAFGKSLVYAAANKGKETYDAQVEAINLNPYIYRYHSTFANTNLALANNLASQENLTDDQKKMITQLVSQSIRDAKVAVALDPQNSASWANLANIYRQLINFARGADQWAVTTYIQAIRLDGTNPQLRIDFGGLLLSLKLFDDAIIQYKQAVALKPDYANAYFNLSFAYKQLERYPEAYAAMQNVVSLVDPNSADYEVATKELNALKDLVPNSAQPATASGRQRDAQLTLPDPTPSPKPAGNVEFSESEQKELEPPTVETEEDATQASPSPSASPAPSPSQEATGSAQTNQ